MLLVLMYHQIAHPEQGQRLAQFKQHLSYLADNFPLILPGTPMVKDQLSICLTFDDAYFDFYHHVYPLLETLKIPAVLGIPTHWIQAKTEIASQKRLSVPYPSGLEQTIQHSHAPLCTWTEIREMIASGLVKPASHSKTHANLADANTDVDAELKHSQAMLQAQINQTVDTFIYPFGQMTRQVHQRLRQFYQYGMRIGSAINHDWHSQNGLLYRLDADHIWPTNRPINNKLIRQCQWKYWINRLRNK